MARAWSWMPSWVALALLVALLAAAMEHSLAEEEQGPAEPTPMAPIEPLETDPDSNAGMEAADAPAPADEEATDDVVGAPAPSPASEVEEESPKSSIGAKAKAGFHSMMEGLSAGKAKLECKVLGNCPADAPAP